MTVSLWQRSTSGPAEECECLIIGAGICGLSAGLHLQRRGIETIILERGRIGGVGGGASARNAGFLMRGAADNYAAAINIYGRDLARLIWRWTEESLAGLRAEGIEDVPGYARRPSCLLALQELEYGQLRDSAALLREDGFAVQWVDAGDDDAWRNMRPLGGLLNPDDAVCNPVNILRHLAAQLRQPVREESEVAEIVGDSAGRARVKTPGRAYLARRVLICTNAYLPQLLPAFARLVMPRRGQLLAVRRPGARLDHAYYANFGFEYFRQTDAETAIFGGCRKAFADREVGYDDTPAPTVQGAIEQFAAAVLGIDRRHLDITARWAGIMGFSPDGLPLVGPIEGDWPAHSVHFCGGFTGHGMSLAHRVSRAAVEAMLDDAPTPLSLARVNAPPPTGVASATALP
jgi:gamma-glutamylputrescine oxidase